MNKYSPSNADNIAEDIEWKPTQIFLIETTYSLEGEKSKEQFQFY